VRAAVVGGDDARTRRVIRDLSELGFQTRFGRTYEEADDEIVISYADHGLEDEVSAARAAVSAGAIYLSAAESPEAVKRLFGLSDEVAGSAVIVGCGWRTSLGGLLSRLAAEELDGDLEVTISWVRPQSGNPGIGLITVLSPGEKLQTEDVYFPEPLGWQKLRNFFGAETVTIPKSVPSVKNVKVRAGLTGSRGSRILGRVGLGQGNSFDSWSSVRVDVRAADSNIVSFAVLDQLLNLETSPLVAAAVMISGGELRAKGVTSLEAAVDSARFVEVLSDRGIRAARLHRHDS
jgi:hypothetical protein